MTMKISTTWRGLVPGDKYLSDWPNGREIPENLVEFFDAEGVAQEVEDAVAAPSVDDLENDGDEWTKEDVEKCRVKAPLIEMLKADPELEVEGIDNMKLADLKAAAIVAYFTE